MSPLVAAQIALTCPSDKLPSANRTRTTGNRANSVANTTSRDADPELVPHPPRNHIRVLACPCDLAAPTRCAHSTRAAIAEINRSRANTNS
ncbi:hypothetical protein Psi02_05450 [Planotetraspora silvatica]|uniref:Uncharacterized protein n=1 Tax=Planotetraspora silvatica TaxID=234614 RepID=A0A8J3XLF4_9ACTN|nr:hypothetical protein Psi02_05450 [Planotetraspora silvatica]